MSSRVFYVDWAKNLENQCLGTRIAAFLAIEDSSYITGQIIYRDGGRMALNYVVPVED